MVGDVKKYRTVFDRWEISYLSVELAFYNKLFDEKNWKAKLSLKAYTLEDGRKTKEHCVEIKTVDVPSNDNIITFNYGWGNNEFGKYWKEGWYIWEAYIDDKLVGSADFYIEDQGLVTAEENKYFTALSLRTYEGPQGDIDVDERRRITKSLTSTNAATLWANSASKTRWKMNGCANSFLIFTTIRGF